jgi:hypothetical protein
MKTFQEIMSEQRLLTDNHKVSEKSVKRNLLLEDEEWRKNVMEKISGALTGREGRKKTEDEKKRISQSNKGKTHSNETKKKISEIKTGKTHSTESKQKIKKAALMPKRTKYRYFTPNGVFETRHEMLDAFPEYTHDQIVRFIAQSLQGFSRVLK